jgi:hypothetical protein
MTLIALAGILLFVAAYAQWQTASFVRGESRALALRLLLVLLGTAVGIVAGRTWSGSSVEPGTMFLIGFGLVHVPAAAILFLKHHRGEGQS